jgi:hypothetical protein
VKLHIFDKLDLNVLLWQNKVWRGRTFAWMIRKLKVLGRIVQQAGQTFFCVPKSEQQRQLSAYSTCKNLQISPLADCYY